jgi:hypothetical protein
MLYLYALASAPATLPSTPGIAEALPFLEHVDGLCALVSEASEPSGEEAVLAHARVVDDFAERNEAVLPARFGSGFADSAGLCQSIGERVDELNRALDRVRGCVELGLRVVAPSNNGKESATGRDYMRTRLEELRAAERAARELHEPLANLARATDQRVAATPSLLLSAAYLVPREQVDQFRDTVARLAEARPELTVACSGPWPAYSFALLDERAA